VSDTQLLGLARGEPEPEERIDLHGARRDIAGRLVTKRIESARAQGLRCVLVIHGRGQHSAVGEAVLRDALPDWLSAGPTARHVLAFTPAPERLGGSGATLVLLRGK
jgi:DNA-nicking Smr family endonuclease